MLSGKVAPNGVVSKVTLMDPVTLARKHSNLDLDLSLARQSTEVMTVFPATHNMMIDVRQSIPHSKTI